jgi:hypothetical protein
MSEEPKGLDAAFAAFAAGSRNVERSPNYPSIPLTQAVDLAAKLYEREKRTPVAPEAAVKAFGYGALSGTARTVLASLRQYGLVESVKDGGTRISELAMEIIHHPIGSVERTKALKDAATRPPLIVELMATHADASDDSLRAFLITRKKFSPDGAGRFIPAFREAVQIARLPDVSSQDHNSRSTASAASAGATTPLSAHIMAGSHMSATLTTGPRNEAPRAAAATQQGGEVMEFVWQLSGDVIATMIVSKNIELDDVDTLFSINIEGARRAVLKQAKSNAAKAANSPSPIAQEATNAAS